MKDFKKFSGTKESREKPEIKTDRPLSDMKENELPDINDFDPKDVNLVKNMAKKYIGKENELMSDILSVANKNKKDGKLKNSDLSEFENKLSPMLNSQQKKMLKDILSTLKD